MRPMKEAGLLRYSRAGASWCPRPHRSSVADSFYSRLLFMFISIVTILITQTADSRQQRRGSSSARKSRGAVVFCARHHAGGSPRTGFHAEVFVADGALQRRSEEEYRRAGHVCHGLGLHGAPRGDHEADISHVRPPDAVRSRYDGKEVGGGEEFHRFFATAD